MDKKKLLQRIYKWLSAKLNICIIVIYIITVLLCLIFPSLPSVFHSSQNTGVADVSSEWFYKLENGSYNTMSSYSGTQQHTPKKDTIYQLTSNLPNKLPDDYAIMFTSKNCWITVLINGNLHYQTQTDEVSAEIPYLGKKVHVITIPNTAAGQTIDIYFKPVTNHDTSLINTIYAGTENMLVDAYVQKYALPLFISLLILGVSTLLIIIGLLNHKRLDGQVRLYFGLFSFCFGIVAFTHLNILSLFTNCSIFLYELEFLTMALLPYPALCYTMAAHGILPTLRHNIVKAVPLLNFLFVVFMHITGLMPLNQTRICTIIMIGYLVVVILYYVIKKHLKLKPWKNLKENGLDYIYLIFLISCAIEIYLFHAGIIESSLVVSHYMLLIILLGQLVHYARQSHQLIEIGINAKHLEDAAFYDALTGLRNRTALNQDIEKLEKNLTSNSAIAIIQMDINFLKRTNDILGHIAGDRLLKNAASAIHAGFADYGKCYRFGGDEFIVILENNPKEKYNLGISAMESACDKINKSLPPMEHVSIAYGIAYYEPDSDTSLWRVQERADVVMYERKRSMKEKKASKTKYKDDRL